MDKAIFDEAAVATLISLVDCAQKQKAVDYSTNDVRDPTVVNTRKKSSAEQRKNPQPTGRSKATMPSPPLKTKNASKSHKD